LLNDTVHEHVYTVNKRVSIREETGIRSYARNNGTIRYHATDVNSIYGDGRTFRIPY